MSEISVKKISDKGNILELEFTNGTAAYMNTLRRTLMTEVPTLAIELVEIAKNGSVLYDEVLAHRLGLVPLTTPVGDYTLPTKEEQENQDFTARSSVKATLKAVGPCTVYAKDLQFADAKVKPVYPNTPIAKLLEGQDIELIATATLGQGRTHTKWSPGLVYYHEIGALKGKPLLVGDERTQREKTTDLVEESPDFQRNTGHYYFKIESWGQLKPLDMFTLAIDEFNKMLKEFDATIKEA